MNYSVCMIASWRNRCRHRWL